MRISLNMSSTTKMLRIHILIELVSAKSTRGKTAFVLITLRSDRLTDVSGIGGVDHAPNFPIPTETLRERIFEYGNDVLPIANPDLGNGWVGLIPLVCERIKRLYSILARHEKCPPYRLWHFSRAEDSG